MYFKAYKRGGKLVNWFKTIRKDDGSRLIRTCLHCPLVAITVLSLLPAHPQRSNSLKDMNGKGCPPPGKKIPNVFIISFYKQFNDDT